MACHLCAVRRCAHASVFAGVSIVASSKAAACTAAEVEAAGAPVVGAVDACLAIGLLLAALGPLLTALGLAFALAFALALALGAFLGATFGRCSAVVVTAMLPLLFLLLLLLLLLLLAPLLALTVSGLGRIVVGVVAAHDVHEPAAELIFGHGDCEALIALHSPVWRAGAHNHVSLATGVGRTQSRVA